MNLSNVVIYLASAFFVLYGLGFILFPATLSLWVMDSVVQGSSAAVDFRATYGGMTFAVGAALLYLHHQGQTGPCLMVIILVLMSMAVARCLGFIVDGATNPLMVAYLVLELLGSGLALLAIRSMRTS